MRTNLSAHEGGGGGGVIDGRDRSCKQRRKLRYLLTPMELLWTERVSCQSGGRWGGGGYLTQMCER